MKLVLASFSIPYADKKLCLYDLEKHALVLNRKGQVRVFAHRASARGTRSRIVRGKQALYTEKKQAKRYADSWQGVAPSAIPDRAKATYRHLLNIDQATEWLAKSERDLAK